MGNSCVGGSLSPSQGRLDSPLINEAVAVSHSTSGQATNLNVISVENPVLFEHAGASSKKASVAMSVEEAEKGAHTPAKTLLSDSSASTHSMLDIKHVDSSSISSGGQSGLRMRHDTFANGDSYSGEYMVDMTRSSPDAKTGKVQMIPVPLMHGNGKYTYADGSSFVGEYKKGQMFRGVFTHVTDARTVITVEEETETGAAAATAGAASSSSSSSSADTTRDPASAAMVVRMSEFGAKVKTRTTVEILTMSVYEGEFEEGRYHGTGKITYVDNGAAAEDGLEDDFDTNIAKSVKATATAGGSKKAAVTMATASSSTSHKSGVERRRERERMSQIHERRIEVAYDGQWRNGRRQGFGACLLYDGRTIEGYWYADRLLACVDSRHHYEAMPVDKFLKAEVGGSRRASFRALLSPRDKLHAPPGRGYAAPAAENPLLDGHGADASAAAQNTCLVEEQAREICPDGSVYFGSFNTALQRHTARHASLPAADLEHKHEPLGAARLTFPNGDILISHFRAGKVFGRGVMQYKASGTLYDGHFRCHDKAPDAKSTAVAAAAGGAAGSQPLFANIADTKGTVAFADGGSAETKVTLHKAPYISMSIERHGEGKCTYAPSGDVYIGQFVHDRKEGMGVYVSHAGSIFRGSYHSDQFHGQGTFRWNDGAEYSGYWRNGKKSGPIGRMTYASGNTYFGAWYEDKKHGPGQANLKNGNVFVGTYVSDLKEGQGSMLYADTGIYEVGKYQSGELQRVVHSYKPGQSGYCSAIQLEAHFQETIKQHEQTYLQQEKALAEHEKQLAQTSGADTKASASASTSTNAKDIAAGGGAPPRVVSRRASTGNTDSSGAATAAALPPPPPPGSIVEVKPVMATGTVIGAVHKISKMFGISKRTSLPPSAAAAKDA